ncbi:MAG TPA: LLM class flavin-dependent oxidoreductase, partial [Acidimicrobiia bacterium]|nr:LLM class flavin-dependent oxidoreductase [Acidimicrobiia bacterium]
MRFGTFVPQGWKGDQNRIPVEDQWNRILGFAELFEDSGYDSIWVYDHFHTHPVLTQESTFDAWTLMAALAAVTSRVRLGQMCTCALYRPPSLLAKMASNIDVI